MIRTVLLKMAGGFKRRAHPAHWKVIRGRHMIVITFKNERLVMIGRRRPLISSPRPEPDLMIDDAPEQ